MAHISSKSRSGDSGGFDFGAAKFDTTAFELARRQVVELTESVDGLVSALKKASIGRDFNRFWIESDELINRAKKSYSEFKYAVSDTDKVNYASEFIKSLNAYIAKGGEAEDITESLEADFSRAAENIKKIEASAIDVVKAFNVDAFKTAFAELDGALDLDIPTDEVKKLLSVLNTAASDTALKRQLEEANDQVVSLRAQVEKLKERLAESHDANLVEGLRKELDQTKSELAAAETALMRFRLIAEREFKAFLMASNISPSSREGIEYLDKLKNSAMTSGEAIREFKREYRYLLSDTMSSDVSSLDMSRVVADIQEASSAITSIVSSIGSDGIPGALSGGGGSSSVIDLNAFVSQLQQIATMAPESQVVITSLCNSITTLVNTFKELSDVGTAKLDSVGYIISSLSGLTGVMSNVTSGTKAVANTAQALADLAKVGSEGTPNLKWLTDVKLDGLNDVKITKTKAENLRSFIDGLVRSSEINVDALDKVTKLNFDNLKGLKFDKESLSGLADLANVTDKVQALQKIVEETTGKSVEATARDIEASKKPLGDPDMIETYRSKVIQLNQAITTAHDNLRRWTAGDESYKAYEGQVKQLESLYDRIKDLTRSQYDSQYKAIQEQMSESIKDMAVSDTRQKVLTADTKEYVDAMLNLERIKSTVSGDDKYTGMILSLSAKLKTEKMTVKEFSEELSKLKLSIAEGKNTGGIGEKLLGDDLDAYSKKAKEIVSLIISATANLDKWSAASTGASKGSFEQYAKDIESLRGLVDVMDGFSAKNVSEQVSIITADMKECELAIRDAGEAMKLPAVIDVGSEQYKSSMAEIARLQQQIALNASKWTAAQDGASSEAYNNYVAQGEALNVVSQALQTGTLEAEDYKEAIRGIKSEMDSAANTIKIAGENRSALPLVNKDDPATVKAYYSNLEKTDNLIKQITQNVNKWTAAEEGQSRESFSTYKNLINDLEELQEKVKAGTITQEEFNTEFSRIKSSAAEASRSIATVGENASKFGSLMDRAADAAQRFIITYLSIRDLIRYASQMVRTSMEIESAMTRIQIITGSTDRQMQSFFEVASSNAKDLGKSIQDVAASIETFTRLGYSMNDASILSKYATIMSNVADTTTDAATTGLTSIIKGYGLDVADVEHVTDVLVQVGQKYAISAEELMEAFERGGAALAASGTSFEQSAALFAATNAALQNANVTGTMWKTNYCLCVQKCA